MLLLLSSLLLPLLKFRASSISSSDSPSNRHLAVLVFFMLAAVRSSTTRTTIAAAFKPTGIPSTRSFASAKTTTHRLFQEQMQQKQQQQRSMSLSSTSSSSLPSSSSSSINGVVIHWFRLGDLRLHDNPALQRSIQLCTVKGTTTQTATKTTKNGGGGNGNNALIPVFCFDPTIFGDAARSTSTTFLKCCPRRAQFIIDSVLDLRQSLQARGSNLVIAPPNSKPEDFMKVLLDEIQQQQLAKATNAPDGGDSESNSNSEKGGTKFKTKVIYQDEVCSEERDAAYRVNKVFNNNKESIWGSTLYNLSDLPYFNDDGKKTSKSSAAMLLADMPDTFTPFRNKVEKNCKIDPPIPTPNTMPSIPTALVATSAVLQKQLSYVPKLADLGYTTEQIHMASQDAVDIRGVMGEQRFRGGETAALQRIHEYIWEKDLLQTYFDTRNGMIGKDYSTKISPWLAHGNISPKYIAYECRKYEEQRVANKSTYWLVFELLWRDFFKFFALKHGSSIFFPGGTIDSRKEWNHYEKNFIAWKEGRTGFPLVDANMRELQATGFMSNRGRQNVCSFLVFELNEDWRNGAEYFESSLIDYDVYSNWGNWCSGAGMTGGRINRFNIVKQSKDYDQHGEYVKRWLPELRNVPTEFVHEPWKMNQLQQIEYNCRLGVNYPNPIVKPFYPKYSKNNDNGDGRKGKQKGGRGNNSNRDGENPNRGRGQRRDMKSLKQGSWSISG